MLDVFLTCDTEVWCNGWGALDAEFPSAFRRYVYGHTPKGDFGLPYQVRTLNDHGLRGVFFVEPLFAARFGMGPLEEIVGIVRDAGHDVQLHLHTEWADEAKTPLLQNHAGKRQHLRYFSADEQNTLIEKGASLLQSAGGGKPVAFRAGSFGFNRDTLSVLPKCGIRFDSSYDGATMGPTSGVSPGELLVDATRTEGVYEYPLSVIRDGMGKLRHVQLGACSAEELEQALWAAHAAGLNSFVLLFHNFELLNQMKTQPDRIVVHRFERLCRFLSDNKASFRVTDFSSLEPKTTDHQPQPLPVSRFATGKRVAEQIARRFTS